MSVEAKEAVLGQLAALKAKYDEAVEARKKVEQDIETVRPVREKLLQDLILSKAQILIFVNLPGCGQSNLRTDCTGKTPGTAGSGAGLHAENSQGGDASFSSFSFSFQQQIDRLGIVSQVTFNIPERKSRS